jgi:hypothetical protein
MRELRVVTAPRARPLHAHRFRVVGRVSAGPGRQAEAHPAFLPITHSRPPHPVGYTLGPDTVRGLKNHFLLYLIPEILAKFQNS